MSTIEPAEDAPPRRRWPFWVGGLVLAVGCAIGWYAWAQYRTLTSSRYRVVSYTVPQARELVAASGETVYRIDPTQSSVTYSVDEKLFGETAGRVHATTNGIAGDIAINAANPGRSRLGRVVVNVEQLHSDNNLRDARLRADYLESHRFPLAYLSVGDLSGLPASIADGRQYRFRMPSRLTVKESASAVTWNVKARMTGGELRATATADLKLSTLGIGPISIAGLVSTGDDVELTMRLTALDPSQYVIPTTIEPPASAPRSGDSPSFERAVLPALEANCASCHRSGEVGAATWKFDAAGDAQRVADGIGTVVEAGYMPPWPASTKGVPLAHSRRLDQKAVAAIVKWARAGGPIDVPRSRKVKVRRGPLPDPPRRDAVLTMPDAYAGSVSVADDYRCFVLDPHLTTPTYMTGYEVTPGVRSQIHHAEIFHQGAGQAAVSLARSGQDGKPGWTCYSAAGAADLSVDVGLIAGWVPGEDPVVNPQGAGILLMPGDVLVLQMHYHYGHHSTPIPDRTTVSLQLDAGTAPIKRMQILNPIAPVEIPCMPRQTAALCSRDAAIAENARLYGPISAAVEDALLRQCGTTSEQLFRIFKRGVASSSCVYSVPTSGQLVGVLGHMHRLGQSLRITLDPGTPNEQILLDIPTWNFGWQKNYQFTAPIDVEEGQKIQLECSWDRALDPNRPPKYIVYAEGTEDEMCFATYALIPDEPIPNAPVITEPTGPPSP